MACINNLLQKITYKQKNLQPLTENILNSWKIHQNQAMLSQTGGNDSKLTEKNFVQS